MTSLHVHFFCVFVPGEFRFVLCFALGATSWPGRADVEVTEGILLHFMNINEMQIIC